MDMSITPDRIVEIIAIAPGWTRVGITAPDPRTRAVAMQAFAEFISDQLVDDRPMKIPGQMILPL